MPQHPRLHILFLVAFLAVFGVAPGSAQWMPGGATVSDFGYAFGTLSCADGAGGVVIGWHGGYAHDDADYNIYCQRLDSGGYRSPQFGPGGIRAAALSGDDYLASVVSDGVGGAFLVWVRVPIYDIYAQHILADGQVAPGWPSDGTPVVNAPYTQDGPVAIADAAGLLTVFWNDYRAGGSSPDIYFLKLGPDGTPLPGWPTNGRPVIGSPGVRGGVHAIDDGQGGYFVVWHEPPYVNNIPEIHFTRLAGDGSPCPGWPAAGKLLVLTRGCRGLVTDAAGGCYVATSTFTAQLQEKDYHLFRFTGAGDLAPGWLATGNAVCTAPVYRYALQLVSDQQGGAILQWQDSRFSALGELLYAARFLPDGTRAPGWPVDGQRVTNWTGFDEVSSMVADGAGGAYFGFNHGISGKSAYIQHLRYDGSVAPGWPGSGFELGAFGEWPWLVTDGAGGAIAAWYSNATLRPLAQRYVFDGIVATELSLASGEAQPDRVRLAWQGAGAGALEALVERREATGSWQRIGTAERESEDRLRYEDRDVVAGRRYGYRLRWNEDGQTQTTAESWIEVPAAAELSLAGLRPNPAVGEMRVEFALANGSAATLELVDLTGRRVLVREVGSLGAGRHVLRLGGVAEAAPGIYWLRLRQGADVRTTRAVVMR